MSSLVEKLLELVENVGTIDGRFTNIHRLNSALDGHFSLLFSADDMQTGRRVALKVFNPFGGDSYRLACFEREESILRELAGQPDIIAWMGARSQFNIIVPWEGGGQVPVPVSYFATELACESVAKPIAEGRWDLIRSLEAFRAMCRSVRRLHVRKIAHRDLKPSNFLIMSDGSIKLADFGTARDYQGAFPSLAQPYFGPPGDLWYSAPEMIATLHDVQHRIAFGADLFSLGAILFELCTGSPLGLQVYDQRFIVDLHAAMQAVKAKDRRAVYDQFVRSIVDARPLPGVGGVVPSSIRERINALYRSLSSLDYRERLQFGNFDLGAHAQLHYFELSPSERASRFERVFREIDACLRMLRREEQYQRWRALKRHRRQIASMRGIVHD